jgi:NTP pyrophosphatase (non-canonical NTP hydrolase)
MNHPEAISLQQQIDLIFGLYGLRNATHMRGEARQSFLLSVSLDLAKVVRKPDRTKQAAAAALASAFAAVCAYADSFVNLDIVAALQQKFPLAHCAYCGKMPCDCPPIRTTDIVLAEVTGSQSHWSILDWCAHFENLYGPINRERGIEKALGRYFEEICEVAKAVFVDTHDSRLDCDQVRARIAREFADLFAWIFGIANLVEVNIQYVIEQRYNGTCGGCGRRPCKCGHASLNLLQEQDGGRACTRVLT